MVPKINQLRLLQQNLQNVSVEKQQLQERLSELESAMKELQDTSQAYKIVGGIMILADKKELLKESEEKKEMLELRLKNYLRQEAKLNESIEVLQKEVVKEIKEGKKDSG